MSTLNDSEDSIDRFCSGDVLKYALTGVDKLPDGSKAGEGGTIASAIRRRYGTHLSPDTADILFRVESAYDSAKLVNAVREAGLTTDAEFDELLPDIEEENLTFERVLRRVNSTLTEALCDRDSDASQVTSKDHRSDVYVPDLVNSEGDVYMAKTLTSPRKVRIAWDLHDGNEVVLVDSYEKWESLFDWKKLKSLPHGKKKVRNELGDQLSDDVLEHIVQYEDATSTTVTESSSSDDGPSRGRRTRTKPSEEVLNLARGSAHSKRHKVQSETLANKFENDRSVGFKIQQVVLFPTTCDKNMTDHWWVAGKRWSGGGQCAIANCNKGTFEYLNQHEQVWHIDDYLEQADEHRFQSSVGTINMRSASTERLVVHIVRESNRKRLMQDPVLENMPSAIVKYCNEGLRNPPDLPHPDDMIYAPISMEDVFWLRPELRKQTNSDDEDAHIICGEAYPRDLVDKVSLSSDYKMYARARLPDWDLDSTELKTIDDASHYFRLDSGGFEMIETLGRLHDLGEQPFSKSPKARW
jgi:hypothetical protein